MPVLFATNLESEFRKIHVGQNYCCSASLYLAVAEFCYCCTPFVCTPGACEIKKRGGISKHRSFGAVVEPSKTTPLETVAEDFFSTCGLGRRRRLRQRRAALSYSATCHL